MDVLSIFWSKSCQKSQRNEAANLPSLWWPWKSGNTLKSSRNFAIWNEKWLWKCQQKAKAGNFWFFLPPWFHQIICNITSKLCITSTINSGKELFIADFFGRQNLSWFLADSTTSNPQIYIGNIILNLSTKSRTRIQKAWKLTKNNSNQDLSLYFTCTQM